MREWIKKNKKWLYMVVLTVFCTVGFLAWSGYKSQAAPGEGPAIWIDAQTQVTGQEIEMRSRTLTLHTTTVGTYKWETTDSNIVEIRSGDTTRTVTLQAKAKGKVTISLEITYTDADGVSKTEILTCDINVVFSIDEDPTYTHIKKIHPSDPKDTRKALVMNYLETIPVENGNTNGIGLVFGDTKIGKWEVANSDIAEVNENSAGEALSITANGAGRTTLTVSYSDGGEQWTDTIEVYVRPQISYEGTPYVENSGDQWQVEKGDLLVPSILQNSQPSVSANNKLTWAIYQGEGGTNVLVCDSKGKKGPNSSMGDMSYSDAAGGYKINLRAGEYYIAYYVDGTYTNFETAMAEDDLGCKPVVVSVRVLPSFRDKEVSINIDGIYDLAEAFNISLPQMANFTVDSVYPDNQYTDYGTFRPDPAKWIFTGEHLGTAYMRVTLNRSLPEIGLNAGDTVRVTVTITESFNMNHTSYTMFVGQTLDLNGIIGSGASTIGSTFQWTSSDESLASVVGSGLTGVVTAKKKTNSNTPVIIRLYWTNSEGLTKVASCSITIKESITKIQLNPTTKDIMVGEVFTITTNANEAVNFLWMSNDESVAKVTPNTGNMSAAVTGVKAGTTVITVLNLDNNVKASCVVQVMPALTQLSIDRGESYTVSILQKNIQLQAVYAPNVKNYVPAMIWSSDNTKVATIDETGWVTLHSPGTTTIYLEPQFNPNKLLARCVLTVEQNATSIDFGTTDVTVEVGSTVAVPYSYGPPGSVANIQWSCMHEDIATVDQTGLVTGVKGGETTVSATIPVQSDTGVTFKIVSCRVHCIQNPTGIAVDKSEVDLSVGESTQVEVTLTPATVTEKQVSWTVLNNKIATVSDKGVITGVSEGETSVFVRTEAASGKQQQAIIKVTVRDKLQGISIEPEEKTITKGKSFKIKVYYDPETAENKNVEWESTAPEIASVDSKGKVSGLKGGVALITCTAEDGGWIASCRVKVREVVSSVTLNKKTLKLPLKQTFQLKAKVESNYATNPSVKWTSSKPGIATVNKKGMVVAKKVGTTVIKCKANDTSGEYAKCTVQVVNPVKRFIISDNYMTISEGRSKKIKTKIKPANATLKRIEWVSSDTDIAVVSVNGKVTGVKEGECKITGTVKDGSGKQAVCYVKVSPLVPATSVVVPQKEMTVVRGTRFGINAKVLPSGHTDTVEYSSDNKMVCTVNSSGTVSALRAGTAAITIMTGSGKTATVTIRVVALNKSSITMRQYDTETIWVDGVDSGVTWYSANPAIATVKGGTITGKKKGVTYVYATVNGCKLACKVRIKKLKKRTAS